MTTIRRHLAAIVLCLTSAVASAQNVVNVTERIHSCWSHEAEDALFYDARKQIPQLAQWPCNGLRDTVYAIESWGLEDGCFYLMYWDRSRQLSVLQDNMSDAIVAHPRRAFTRRIVALVEEWDREKALQLSRSQRVRPANRLYATRVILSRDTVKVDTMSFNEFFGEEDFDDATEMYELWHPEGRRLHECPQVPLEWSFLPGDTVAAYSLGALAFEVRTPGRPYAEEHFPDTAYKERLVVCGQSYMIDSLLFENYNEYSGVYFFSDDAYVIEKDYYIVSFFNAAQMGTMAQPCYLVFKTLNGKACPRALYMLTDIEDNSGRIENTLRYYIEDGNLYLKGENLLLIRTF